MGQNIRSACLQGALETIYTVDNAINVYKNNPRQDDLITWSGLVRLFSRRSTTQITNISEAKAQLSTLIERVVAGEEVIIGKAGKPIAKLVRYERKDVRRTPGALKGKIDIADDFDELPDDISAAFGKFYCG